MSRRSLAAATVAALSLALPAAASAPPLTSGTWVPTLVAPDVLTHDVAAFADGTGFVSGVAPGTASEAGLWTTTDHGATWSFDDDALSGAGSHAFSSPTDWWGYDANSPALRHTTDAGASWTAVSLPLATTETTSAFVRADAAGGALLVAAPLRPATGACATHAALFFTGDGGVTWERHDFPSYASGGPLVASVDVADADTAVVTAWNAVTGCGNAESPHDVYVTNDAGATWTRVVASPSTGPQVTDATVAPDGATVVVAYNDGTVRWSDDGGATFASSTLRYPLLEPLPDAWSGAHDAVADVELAGGAAYAVLNGGSVHRTTDGGATWTVDGLHGLFGLTVLEAFDADRAFTASAAFVATRS